jgi:hypothetical protein
MADCGHDYDGCLIVSQALISLVTGALQLHYTALIEQTTVFILSSLETVNTESASKAGKLRCMKMEQESLKRKSVHLKVS